MKHGQPQIRFTYSISLYTILEIWIQNKRYSIKTYNKTEILVTEKWTKIKYNHK